MKPLFLIAAWLICNACCASPAEHLGSSHLAGRADQLDEKRLRVQLGPRPAYLVEQMTPSALKDQLKSCATRIARTSDFSIGHRGAPLMFPEHTRESYEAAFKTGAGIIECDVTFTRDRELVCRHSQCDLQTTTNILATPLAQKCSEPFTPADPQNATPASARCCTSDITLAEFKTLEGKMDAANAQATTVDEYLNGTANYRTDLYATGATLMTHSESIELFKSFGVGMTPELKAPSVAMPYEGDYTQADYAQQMIDEYVAAGVAPEKVWPQSFNYDDVLYWLANTPVYAQQAVFLDARVYSDPDFEPGAADFEARRADGLRIIAPPTFALLTVNDTNAIVASDYARLARAAGLDIITWTLERSGRLVEDVVQGGNTFYFQSTLPAIRNDGDVFTTLHALANEVGVTGVFTDWPATVTYYANCMGLP